MSKVSTASLPKTPQPSTPAVVAAAATSTPAAPLSVSVSGSSTPATAPAPSGSRTVSAWAKGPPLAARQPSLSLSPATTAAGPTSAQPKSAWNATANGPASLPPSNPPSGTVTPTGTHGRKASVVLRDGVGNGNAASAKPGSAMSFGTVGEGDKPRRASRSASPGTAIAATVSDARTFGSIPAAAKKDEAKPAAAEKKDDKPKDKPKRKIDVNALFQAVPQNAAASAAPSPSPSTTTTGPSLPPTSPPPPAGTPVTGRSAPNGPSAPNNIYNSVPMRPPPGQNMQMMSSMGMMSGNIRPFVPSGPGRGGPPGGPNGVGRGDQPNTPGGAGRGAGPQQQPGSPPPHGRGSMMSPMGMMMPPGGPGSPWQPYYPGLPHYYPGGEPGQPGMPNSPYPAYWHPQGMPGMPHPGMGMPGQPQGPQYHPGMQGQQGMMQQQQQQQQQQQHPHYQGPQHLGPPQQGGHPMSPGAPGRNLPSMQQQQQQGPHPSQQPPSAGPPGTPLSISGLPSPMPSHVHPPPPQQQQQHLPPLPPPQQQQQQQLPPPPTPLSHPQTPSALRTAALPVTPTGFRFPTQSPAAGPPTPGGGSGLNTRATEFVPSSATRKAIKITREDGTLVSLPQHVRTPSAMVGGLASPSAGTAELKEKVDLGVGVGVVRKPSVAVRIESEQEKARREKEARERLEAEERGRREEEERRKREEEERERRKVEEEERVAREEEERVLREKREEEERVEKVKKEEEERVRKEREEQARVEAEEKKAEEEEKARVEAEAQAKAKAEAEAKEKEEKAKALAEEEERAKAAAAAAEAAAAKAAKAAEVQKELERGQAEEAAEKADTLSALPSAGASASQTPTSPSTPELAAQISLKPINGSATLSDSLKTRRPVPGPLDLKSAVMAAAKATPPLSSAQASALLSARPIEDIHAIQYPAGIRTPNPDLNANGPPGKFRYDRDFLMQFMNVCKDRPETLPPLDAIGIENSDPMSQQYAAGGRTPGGAPDRRARAGGIGGKVGLGITGSAGAPFGGKPGFSMGNFQAPARTGADGDRFRSVSTFAGPGGVPMGRPVAMQRTASGSGLANQVPGSPGGGRQRSLRGRQRPDSRQPSQAMMPPPNQYGMEPVEPLTKSDHRWKPQAALPRGQRAGEQVDTPEMVERKVKALLNKLTLEKFDSISDQIVAFANRSEQETDGHTLIHVIKLVFEKATDEPAWSEMYARLCRKMMERISPKVFDVQVKNNDGALIVGGQLFRKYLLNRCQEDFERGYIQRRQLAEESAAAGIPQQKDGEEIIFSEAYYATQKAKRRGLGLVKLIGELFKLQMLTERIMHECIRKMLANVENPEEEEVESLCKLLATVGQQLDTEKAKAHMTIYFQRMKEMVKILRERAERKEVSSRMMFMLQDIIDLREKFNWEPRKKSAGQGPMTIAEVHQAALREEAQKEADKQRQAMSRGGSRRGDPRDYGHDGWQNVQGGPPARPAPPAKAGDLSKFGNISKPSGPIGGFGPSNVFKKADAKGARPEAPAPPTRTNMFNVLGGADAPVEVEAAAPKAPSRKPSVDLGAGSSAADAGSQRKKLKLLPRSIPLKDDESAPPSAVDSVDEVPSMSEEKAKAKIDEDLQEFWQVGDVEEATNYFKDLPSNYHEQLIDKFISEVFNKKEADVDMVADVFSRSASAGSVSVESFKKGLSSTIEFLDDIAVDVPQAYAFMAKLLKGTQLSQSDVEELAGKISVEGTPLVSPKDKLLKEVAKLA